MTMACTHVSDFGLFVDLLLQTLKNLRLQHSFGISWHCGNVCDVQDESLVGKLFALGSVEHVWSKSEASTTSSSWYREKKPTIFIWQCRGIDRCYKDLVYHNHGSIAIQSSRSITQNHCRRHYFERKTIRTIRKVSQAWKLEWKIDSSFPWLTLMSSRVL